MPIVPTGEMICDGFESAPDPVFSSPEVWEQYDAMSGCQKAARRAELCYAAMIAAAPAIAPTVASDAQDNEVLAMLGRVLKYIDPHAVDMELARTGPMEDAYINTIARKCVERHLAIAEATAPATGAAK